MSGTTQNVLSRMSFNGFCPTATGYVAMGQIKFYGGAGAGLGTGLRPDLAPDQKFMEY